MQTIRIFLSSPGDVQDERNRVHTVVESWNRQHKQNLHVELKVFDWDKDPVPEAGDAQLIIEKQAGKYDIYLGILWQRFGKKTKRAGSGTEEEFNNAYDRWLETGKPHILFYFKKPVNVPETDEDAEQWEKVRQFKKRLQEDDKVFYKDFKTEADFAV